MAADIPELKPPTRILMGPGPSGVHPRVSQALTAPILGHLDPDFLRIMDEVQAMLRRAFQTQNALTFPLPGTGTSGMEAAMYNLLEAGDQAVIGVHGYFGARLCEMAERAGAKVTRVDVPWGQPLDLDALRTAARAVGNPKLIAVVHAETSTGISTPIPPVAEIARDTGALLLIDCVTSFGGVEVDVDAWGVDLAYSGTQKCLSAPPGMAPLTASQRAVDAITARKTPPQSWYLDLQLLHKYWGPERVYHHTGAINMVYAVHQALALVLEEGLEARWQRHAGHGSALQAGLEAMGLELLAPEHCRLPVLTTVRIPVGVDDMEVRKALLQRYSVEIGGGLGDLRGKIWRIGLMGESSKPENVLLILSALGALLREAGAKVDPSGGLGAATTALS
jgi:alanine-glyoxylate transaminase/serine-glyoxylate transaminase/serine-pyruvate transaminase